MKFINEKFPEPKYPNITVRLIGKNGNAFNILGIMEHELKAAKVPQAEIQLFLDDAMSGDYNHLLNTCMKWVHVK